MNDTLAWIESTAVGEFIRNYPWAFPTLETLHFMGLCVLFGSLLVIDLRVLGVARYIPMASALKFIPVAVGAFAVNLITGIGFFCADPFRYFPNIAFRWKMLLIVIAGLNALYFQFVEHRKLQSLPDGQSGDFSAKTAAFLSLIIWIAVIVLGRLMPYVEY